MDSGREVGDILLLQTFGSHTGGGHGKVEHLRYGSAYRPFIFLRVALHHIVGHYTGLTVGRAGKIIHPGIAVDGMRILYHIAHGIAADRLTPMGYGKERPKKIKKKVAEKYPWLKVDDELTPDFIKALKNPEKEEICNSLNRRTEFTVLRTTYGLFDENGNLKAQPKPAKKPESSSDDVDFEFYE